MGRADKTPTQSLATRRIDSRASQWEARGGGAEQSAQLLLREVAAWGGRVVSPNLSGAGRVPMGSSSPGVSGPGPHGIPNLKWS